MLKHLKKLNFNGNVCNAKQHERRKLKSNWPYNSWSLQACTCINSTIFVGWQYYAILFHVGYLSYIVQCTYSKNYCLKWQDFSNSCINIAIFSLVNEPCNIYKWLLFYISFDDSHFHHARQRWNSLIGASHPLLLPVTVNNHLRALHRIVNIQNAAVRQRSRVRRLGSLRSQNPLQSRRQRAKSRLTTTNNVLLWCRYIILCVSAGYYIVCHILITTARNVVLSFCHFFTQTRAVKKKCLDGFLWNYQVRLCQKVKLRVKFLMK